MVSILLCQFCGEVIEYFESEKVSKLYGACHQCNEDKRAASLVEED